MLKEKNFSTIYKNKIYWFYFYSLNRLKIEKPTETQVVMKYKPMSYQQSYGGYEQMEGMDGYGSDSNYGGGYEGGGGGGYGGGGEGGGGYGGGGGGGYGGNMEGMGYGMAEGYEGMGEMGYDGEGGGDAYGDEGEDDYEGDGHEGGGHESEEDYGKGGYVGGKIGERFSEYGIKTDNYQNDSEGGKVTLVANVGGNRNENDGYNNNGGNQY